ncbi:unnamed protein product, partial [Brachionus calyciflorus]
EAPELLHRFYSSGSMFVHGGVDRLGQSEEPVVGQLEIDKKIRLLNFKDCHTKIRQVDSQLTIGNGVVVQVTGELSNNGEAMRRFMQTFVLAPQSPKKFYVHNDIFRYQDEIYQDVSDTESEDTPQVQQPVEVKQSASNYFQAEQEPEAVQQPEPTPEPVQEPTEPEQPEQIEQNVEQTMLNGNLHSSSSSASSVPSEIPEKEEEKQPEPEQEPETTEVAEPEVTEVAEIVKPQEQEPVRQEPEPVRNNSWAKIISKTEPNQTVAPAPVAPRPKEVKQVVKPVSQQNGTAPKPQPKPQRTVQEKKEEVKQTQQNEPKPQRQPSEKSNDFDDIEKHITDAELKQFFGQYGKVLEVRINSNTKQPSGRRLPNYGFVVFEEKQHVDALLGNNKTNNLVFKNEKGEFRLNVEEKRARQGRGGYNGQNTKSRVTRSSSNGSRGNKKYNNNNNNNNQEFNGRREEREVDSGRKTSNYRRS